MLQNSTIFVSFSSHLFGNQLVASSASASNFGIFVGFPRKHFGIFVGLSIENYGIFCTFPLIFGIL